MSKNFNKIFGVFGDRGTGKTEFAKGNPSLNLPGLINIYLRRGIKVFIIDTIDHPAWKEIPVVDPQNFHRVKKGAARIITRATDIPKLNQFLNQNPNTWNSLLLYEDARKHTYKTVDKSMIELIGDSKQKNIDIGFMYHCFAHCPLDLYRYFDYIELFKTKDGPYVREEFFKANWDETMGIYNKVKANPNRFYHALLDVGTD